MALFLYTMPATEHWLELALESVKKIMRVFDFSQHENKEIPILKASLQHSKDDMNIPSITACCSDI